MSNDMSLNRDKHKTRFCVDCLVEMSRPEAGRKLAVYFLQEQPQYAFMTTQHTRIVNGGHTYT
jgi:hypothetical protein